VSVEDALRKVEAEVLGRSQAKARPPVRGASTPEPSEAIETAAASITPSRFISLDGLKPRPVRWLWDGRIPVGVGTLVGGLPGGGKTHVGLDVGAKLTRGVLPGDWEGTPSGIVVMSREDMLHETIVPRLIAAGADMSRCLALPFAAGRFSVETDMPELEAAVREVGARYVLLDPMLAFTERDRNVNLDNEVRGMLEPAQRLMEQHKLSITGVMHLNKDVMKDLVHRVSMSGAFVAIVRSVLFVGNDPDDEDDLNPAKVLAHGKTNLSRIAPSLAFRIVETAVPGEDEDGNDVMVPTSRIEWMGDSEVTADQLVKGRGSEGTKLAQAENLIRRLAPAHKATIEREATTLGISRATVERAARRLGIETSDQERDPSTGKLGTAMWRLPV
jgi:hypothetical protein